MLPNRENVLRVLARLESFRAGVGAGQGQKAGKDE